MVYIENQNRPIPQNRTAEKIKEIITIYTPAICKFVILMKSKMSGNFTLSRIFEIKLNVRHFTFHPNIYISCVYSQFYAPILL